MCLSLVKRVSHGVIVQNDRYRGYYMAARRYEISLIVLKNISLVRSTRLWNIFQTWEKESCISKWPCSFFCCCYIIFIMQNNVFGDFPKILLNLVPEARRTVVNIFQKFQKVAKCCRRPLKKVQRCFDHTPTNLWAVTGQKLYKNDITFG